MGVKELGRQYDSALYERLALRRDKEGIKRLSAEGQIIEKPEDLLKDPYVLEFTGLPELAKYSETDLETKIIDHLQEFLLELGRGFTFVGRQVRFTFEDEHYRVDLVFFNRLLRCFVLFDLKIGRLKHQDIGQMQMYVNYYDRKVKLEDENPTIGILLCKNKNDAVVEMTLPEDNNQIFASKYLTVLPSKEDLKKLMESEEQWRQVYSLIKVSVAVYCRYWKEGNIWVAIQDECLGDYHFGKCLQEVVYVLAVKWERLIY